MSFSYKRLAGFGVLFLGAVILLSGLQIKAQTSPSYCPTGTQLHGWAWSTTTGWISFNSQNSGSGGGPHCVSISNSALSGYAWSDNIGWIKFGGLSGFPTVSGASTEQNARLNGTKIVGWARACAGTVKAGDDVNNPLYPGDCSTMTSRVDGWDGWIELSGGAAPTNLHEITMSGNSITGWAWGAEAVGWIQFNLSTAQTVEINTSCSVTASAQGNGSYQIQWESRNANSCSSTSGNFTVNSVSGSDPVLKTPTEDTVYSMMCTPIRVGGTNATCQTSVIVGSEVGGGEGGEGGPDVGVPGEPPDISGPPPALQMWLNNDSNQRLSSMTIREGQQARINWKVNSGTYGICTARLGKTAPYSVLSDFGSSQRPNGSPYTKSDLTAGVYEFSLICNETIEGPVSAKVRGTNQTSLEIIVRDANLEER